jgi:phosphate transport system substrate-binding protein
MKQNSITKFVVFLVLASMVLAACASAAATVAPAPAAPVAEEAAPAADSPTAAPTAEPLSGTISISGAFALYPMMTVWADEFTKLNPGVQFDVQGGGAGKGMTDTIAGAVDIGMISRSIKEEESSQGIFWVSVTKDAVFPIVAEGNPVLETLKTTGISAETFGKIFITGEFTTWGQVVGDPSITDEIHVYTRSDSAGAAEMWAKFSGGKVQDDLKGIALNGEPALVEQVLKDPLGIGYANLNSVYDLTTGQPVPGIVAPYIDVNANGAVDASEKLDDLATVVKAVADGVYPSPPARFENLATKGKPEGVVLAFINWILTDGQAFTDQAGYVPLTGAQQQESLDKLK